MLIAQVEIHSSYITTAEYLIAASYVPAICSIVPI